MATSPHIFAMPILELLTAEIASALFADDDFPLEYKHQETMLPQKQAAVSSGHRFPGPCQFRRRKRTRRTCISESMSTKSDRDSSGLSEEKTMEASDTVNVTVTNQGE
jgi:hypothetical protein